MPNVSIDLLDLLQLLFKRSDLLRKVIVDYVFFCLQLFDHGLLLSNDGLQFMAHLFKLALHFLHFVRNFLSAIVVELAGKLLVVAFTFFVPFKFGAIRYQFIFKASQKLC